MSIVPTGTYSDLFFGSDDHSEHSFVLTPNNDPSPAAYYWANIIGWTNPSGGYIGGGYIGMQTLTTGVGPGGSNVKGVVFSIGEGAIEVETTGVSTNDFDGGLGWSTRIAYPWIAGRSYRFRVYRGDLDVDGQWWNSEVTDLTTSTTTQISRIKVPLAWDGLNGYSILFTERYAGATGTCDDIEYVSADFTNLLADGSISPISIIDHYSTIGTCPNSDVAVIAGGRRHRMGIVGDLVTFEDAVTAPSDPTVGQSHTVLITATPATNFDTTLSSPYREVLTATVPAGLIAGNGSTASALKFRTRTVTNGTPGAWSAYSVIGTSLVARKSYTAWPTTQQQQMELLFTAGDNAGDYDIDVVAEHATADSGGTRLTTGSLTTTITLTTAGGPPPAPPAAPSLASGSRTSTSIAVTWNTPATNGSTITGYRLYQATTGNALVLVDSISPTNSYTFTGLDPSTAYDFAIIAESSEGDSAQSTTTTLSTRSLAEAAPDVSSPTLSERPRSVRCLLFTGGEPLLGATAVTAEDPLNDVGSGGFTLQNDDAQWASVSTGAIIQVQVWNEWSEVYVDAYLWRIEGKSRQTIRTNRSEQITKYAGRGMGADFERSVVYPHNSPNGEGKTPWGPDRTFGWAAPELVDGAWGAPDVRNIVGFRAAGRPDGWWGSPKTFPNPLAQWIWGVPPSGGQDTVGINYFRYHFTTTEELDITFYVTADDWFIAALDGVPIVDFRSTSGDVRNAADQTYWRKLRVPAGDHVFAAKVQNLETPGISNNMGGLVVAATYAIEPRRSEFAGEGYVWGENYSTFEWLFTTANADSVGNTTPGISDSLNLPAALDVATATGTWLTSAYPAMPPGMTPGLILSILFNEAQGRGELADWALGFDDLVDSNNVAWPTIVPDFSVPVGTTFLEVLNKLVADGYIEWACRPGAVVLDVWAAGTKGTSVPAAFAYGENILTLDHDDKWGAAIGSLLVGWDEGFFRLGTGARGSYLSIGDAKDLTEATNRAQKQIDRADDDSTGIVASIWPVAENQLPWASWQTADSPTLPDWDGNPAEFVATSIAVSETGETGRFSWTTQFVSRRRQAEELAAKLAQRAVPGGLNGRSESVAPAAPRQEQGGTLELEEFQFDLPGKASDNDTAAVSAGFSQSESGFERTERRIKFMSASLEATDGSIGTTTVDMFMNQDYDHPVITLDLVDGQTTVDDYFGSEVIFGGNLTDNWYIEMGAGEVGGTKESLQVRLRNDPAEHPNLVFRVFGFPIP